MNTERDNGIFYTPPEVANFVANLAIPSADSTVLDPCYGEGSLLLAAYSRLLALHSKSPKKQIFGYELNQLKVESPKNMLHRLIEDTNLKEMDFFSPSNQESGSKFDVILMNPPFVKHHLIYREDQKRIRHIVGEDFKLPLTSDLWAYFVIHSFKFIQEGGNLAVILPWSFFHADFARTVRELLLERFRRLRVVIIGKRMFEKANERIMVLLGEDFGIPSSGIGIFYSYDTPNGPLSYSPVKQDLWRTSPWMCLITTDMHEIISKFGDDFGFEPLNRFAKIRIGTVTGANDFFILNKAVAQSMKLPERILKPIITHSSDLSGLVMPSNGVSDVLLSIPENMELPSYLKDYIGLGEENGLNKRYHTRKRIKWYSIPEQKPPDGFLHYMTKEVPFLVLNSGKLLSTNTIHQVDFFDNVNENTKKWIQLSMLTSISQLTVELLGRTYGGGILKIEPTASGKILVYPGNEKKSLSENIEEKLNDLLLKGNRREAMKVADAWMLKNMQVSNEEMDLVMHSYRYIRDLRLGANQTNYERALL